MTPVEGDGHTDCTVKMKSYEKKDIVDILASAGGAPTIPEEEISRKNRQTVLEHQGKSVKRKFTTGKNTLEKLMLTYEKEFPTESTNLKQLRMPKT